MDKPEIEFFDPEPPTDLVVTDLTEGDGAEATSGSTVSATGRCSSRGRT